MLTPISGNFRITIFIYFSKNILTIKFLRNLCKTIWAIVMMNFCLKRGISLTKIICESVDEATDKNGCYVGLDRRCFI